MQSSDSRKQQELCSFCGEKAAAVLVDFSTRKKSSLIDRKRSSSQKPYCWLHYYTTRAVRVDPDKVQVMDDTQQEQLEEVQPLFAQAFIELQQELSETAARSFTNKKQSKDPLAVLHDLRGKPKRAAGLPKKKQSPGDAGGGFLRTVPIPERMRRQQEQQERQKQDASVIAASTNSNEVNPYKRRKASRKSIWNLALDAPPPSATLKTYPPVENDTAAGVTCSSCNSTKVVNAGNSGIRQDTALTKGETWGNKDRVDTVMMKYQCQDCGKVWNEEE